jgi:hypothetical protein
MFAWVIRARAQTFDHSHRLGRYTPEQCYGPLVHLLLSFLLGVFDISQCHIPELKKSTMEVC